MIKLKFVELHKGLFLAGKNFGEKLDPARLTGLELYHDPERQAVKVVWNGQACYFHWMNAANLIPEDPKDIGFDLAVTPKRIIPTHVNHPQTANIGSAQVEGPHDHVFKGPGSGRVKN